MATVVGVDGYPRGWVAVMLVDGRFAAARVFPTFADVLAAFSDTAAVGVDIPIGLPASGERAADHEARALVGPRRNSVFWTPPRAVLEAPSYAAAVERSRALTGRGISQHAWALRRKVLEVDALVGSGERVVEVHPEVSFRALAGEPLPFAKDTWSGFALRRMLLAGVGIEVPDEIGEAGRATADDVLDAAVAAWTAERVATGTAQTVPRVPETDERGRRIAIWF